MPMKLFDSHCHFHDKRFNDDRDASFQRAIDSGVTRILTLGDDLEASRKAIEVAEQYEGVVAAAGVHPSNARSWNESSANELEELLAHPKVCVLGEIGLDYYWDKTDEFVEIQHRVFREQLRMAKRLNYPVSIHSRESNADVLTILEEEDGANIGGVLHCFSGSLEEARRGLALGFYLGVGGPVTYKKNDELRELLAEIGTEHLVVETDAPYLSPQPFRGKRNEPAYVATTCQLFAEFLSVAPEQMAEVTYNNALKALRIS